MSARRGYQRDPRVDAYFGPLPAGQRQLCQELRGLIHAADPEVQETIKRTDRPYFVLDGNVCAIQAARDHINLFLYDGAIVPDPEGLPPRPGAAGPSTRTSTGASAAYQTELLTNTATAAIATETAALMTPPVVPDMR